jgi:hypothetical protein
MVSPIFTPYYSSHRWDWWISLGYIGVPSLLVIRGIGIVREAPPGIQSEFSRPNRNGGGRDLVVLAHHHFRSAALMLSVIVLVE